MCQSTLRAKLKYDKPTCAAFIKMLIDAQLMVDIPKIMHNPQSKLLEQLKPHDNGPSQSFCKLAQFYFLKSSSQP